MRQAKALIYEGLRHVAGSVPFGREGVLVDEDLGADVARTAKSDGVVLLMPIEKSGSRVFELEYGDQFAEHVEAFDPDFFKLSSASTLSTTRPCGRPRSSAWRSVGMGGTDEPALDH